MVSDKLSTLLDHLKAREDVGKFKTPMARLQASLHELDDDDIADLVSASVVAASATSGGDSYVYAALLITVGLELGRELERRI